MLKNKNIVITGANGGIGKAIVEECIKNNASVWACMRSVTDSVADWIVALNKKGDCFAKIIELDLLNEDSIKNAATTILGEKTHIDGIVNNAGIVGTTSLFPMTDMDDIRRTFEVNFFGPMYFTQRFMKRLIRQKKGSVVNISSIASFDGDPGQFGYVSSKAAVNGATKKLSNELGVFGIRVNAIAPGITDTNMISEMDHSLLDKTLERTSMKRLGTPKEIAKLCVYLLSDESSFITGQIVRADGGSI